MRPTRIFLLRYGLYSKGPNETQQLGSYERDHLSLVRAPRHQLPILGMQPCCAFQAIAFTSSLTEPCRLRRVAPRLGRCRYAHTASTTLCCRGAFPVLVNSVPTRAYLAGPPSPH